MCLRIHPDSEAIVLEEDLVVFKVVKKMKINTVAEWRHISTDETSYLSPYQNFKYVIGQMYESEFSVRQFTSEYSYQVTNFEPPSYLKFHSTGNPTFCGVEEGLHSFATFNAAKKFTDSFNGVNARLGYGESLTILQCVIPAGSKAFLGEWEYADGPFDVTVNSYASDTLRVVREIL